MKVLRIIDGALFHLDLVAPDKLTFSGEVDRVDVPGIEGDFGILPGHAAAVSLLRPGILTIYARRHSEEDGGAR